MQPRFFANAGELRNWFRENHDKLDEQWIGYFKKDTGVPSIDWPQSVDVALCFGWIDGIRKRNDDESYMVRFTPRRPRSRWSTRNIGRMEALMADGLVEAPGMRAFRSRNMDRPQSETAARTLPPDLESRLKANPDAWRYFQGARPSYRKQAALWITSAKKAETRMARLGLLIESCAGGMPVPPLRRSGKAADRSTRTGGRPLSGGE